MTEKPPLHQSKNTTSWVDDLYSKRLARQAIGYVGRKPDEDNPLHRLSALRKSRLYLRDELVRGPRFNQSIRAYFLDLSPSDEQQALSILHCDYDPRNGKVRPTTAAAAVHVAVTLHALERLHERLRTNALGDVYRIALRPLSRVPPPEKSQYERQDLVFHLEDFGVLPVRAIGAIARPGVGVACWGVLTFVDREPRSDECVISVLHPES